MAPDINPAGVYLIEKGYVKIYSIRNSGDLNLHIIYKAGEMFPLIWAFIDRRTRVYYQAFTDASLKILDRAEFLQRTTADARLNRYVLDDLATHFWLYADRLENLELPNVMQRVAYRLSRLMTRFGKPQTSGKVVIEVPLTQQDIAESINLARETVSRSIEKLAQAGVLTYQNHKLVILKPGELEKSAEI